MEITSKNDDKLTYIFARELGGIIEWNSIVSNSSFAPSNFSFRSATPTYTYEKGTKLYGAARKGNEWRAV
ncbi:hypothetical protein [Marinilabilia salmonicolor]|uniref:Uncharacterized protein n=1 Tax=Marinilabilia salmonicolor TaxID=989 RepID=A0A368UPZ4_9BACT|nr:hypothetical protein [Marinilabilia salmonicolor]RCW28891.1 hypothetical protein DFO77_1345 [Marinilabilia salmonicolor]